MTEFKVGDMVKCISNVADIRRWPFSDPKYRIPIGSIVTIKRFRTRFKPGFIEFETVELCPYYEGKDGYSACTEDFVLVGPPGSFAAVLGALDANSD